MNLSSRIRWWLALSAAILMPMLFTKITYQIAASHPGSMRQISWELLSLLSFLMGFGIVIILLLKTKQNVITKVPAALAIAVLMGFSSISMLARPMCSPSPEFIGGKLPNQDSKIAQAHESESCS